MYKNLHWKLKYLGFNSTYWNWGKFRFKTLYIVVILLKKCLCLFLCSSTSLWILMSWWKICRTFYKALIRALVAIRYAISIMTEFFDFFIKLSKVPRPMWSRLMTLLHIGKIQVISNRRLWLANGFVKNVRVSHLYWRFFVIFLFFSCIAYFEYVLPSSTVVLKIIAIADAHANFPSTFSMFLKSCLRKYFEEIEINCPLRKICVCRKMYGTYFD